MLCGIGIGADGLQVMQEIWNGAAATQLPEFDIPLLSGWFVYELESNVCPVTNELV